MPTDAAAPTAGRATVTPDAEGALDLRGRGAGATRSPPGSTTPSIKIPAGVDVELMFTEGALLLERVAAGLPPERRGRARAARTRSTALRDTSRPAAARLAPRSRPDGRRRARRAPAARPGHRRGPLPAAAPTASGRSSAPGTSSSRAPRAPTSTRRPAAVVRHLRAPPPKRLDAVAAMGFDVVYLPPIHPIGRGQPQGPQQHPRPRARRPRLAVGDRLRPRAATTRSTPTSARSTDFDAFVARAGELGLEVALDLALQAAPDHPWVTEHPEWFTTRADGTIAYAENPPKKYQDIYPINFDNDPDGIYAEVLRIVRLLDDARRADLPRRQPAHQAGRVLGVAARRGPRDRPRRALPGRGVHPAGDDAHAGHGRLPPVLHLLHLAQREVGARGVPHARSPTRPATCMRPNFFVNTPDILHAFLQYGGPAAFKIRAVLAATGSPTWGVYAGFELYEHVARAARQRGVPRHREVPDPDPRLGRRRAPRGAPWRRTSPGSTRSAARTRRCSSCAT